MIFPERKNHSCSKNAVSGCFSFEHASVQTLLTLTDRPEDPIDCAFSIHITPSATKERSVKEIAIIDRNRESVRKLEAQLRGRGYRVESYGDETVALERIGERPPDLVISELALKEHTGPEIIRELRRIAPALPVIIITGHSNTQNAIDSMREGAYDYFAKPLDTEKTLLAIEKALDLGSAGDGVSFTGEGDEAPLGHGSRLIGKSPEMLEIYKRIGQVAASDAAVLIQGESGTGKELVSQAIHDNSKRRTGPFLAVNCAAIPETLLESELFGYEKGAFTGAVSRKTGKFEQANHGTIFLDEIGDMTLSIQAKVLRVLQDKAFERVGGRETIQVNTRVVAATNKSLVECMKSGAFRVDLFYRLKVVSIFLPPLRERGSDVLLLAEFFRNHYNTLLGKNVRGISAEAVELLHDYHWPGNVRELENNVQTAVLLNKSGVLSCEDFPVYAERERGESAGRPGEESVDLHEAFHQVLAGRFASLCIDHKGSIYDKTVQDFERALIGLALGRVGGNQVRASKLLGISRNTLRNRIERFGGLDNLK